MTAFGPAIWNVLHDAVVVGISKTDKDSVTLELDCDYLRDRFDESGDRFILRLQGCDRLTYHPRDERPLSDVRLIAARRLWIVRAEAAAGHLRVHCDEHNHSKSGGELHVSAMTFDLSLDTGTEVSLSQITEVAEEYWQEWDYTAQKNRGDS